MQRSVFKATVRLPTPRWWEGSPRPRRRRGQLVELRNGHGAAGPRPRGGPRGVWGRNRTDGVASKIGIQTIFEAFLRKFSPMNFSRTKLSNATGTKARQISINFSKISY